MTIHSLEELDVYQPAFEIQQEIFELTKGLPNEGRYALTDQIRRASRSVGANMADAEKWKPRKRLAVFAQCAVGCLL